MKYKEIFLYLIEKEIQKMEQDYENLKPKEWMFDLEKHRLTERLEFYHKIRVYLKYWE